MDHQTQTQKSPSSTTKYKGRIGGGGAVIPQPDGRRTNWATSAQIIYNNHQNWLGQGSVPQTYDRVAASKLRYSDETTQQFSFMNNNYQQNEVEEEEEEDEQTSAEIIEEEEEEDHKQQDEEEEQHEHMFEKPLTPSDVGKLNRLVIPKQHAERYFPLSGDSSDKGLLLSFEDEAGKLWRFRYSYWNSSQSYVLTKGWSRFVKEKRLDAGDVVWFERRRFDVQRLFIRWRRRVVPVQDSRVMTQHHHHHHHPNDAAAAAAAAAWTRMFYSAQQQHHPYPSHQVHGPLLYQPDCLHAVEPIIEKPITKPVNSKRLRLFGVNLDCQLDEDEPPVPDTSSLSSQARTHHFLYSQPDHYGSSHSNHKEFDFSPDVNQMRNGF